jgi:hypothetical protein
MQVPAQPEKELGYRRMEEKEIGGRAEGGGLTEARGRLKGTERGKPKTKRDDKNDRRREEEGGGRRRERKMVARIAGGGGNTDVRKNGNSQ